MQALHEAKTSQTNTTKTQTYHFHPFFHLIIMLEHEHVMRVLALLFPLLISVLEHLLQYEYLSLLD